MTPDRFKAIVDAYGAKPANWPQAERRKVESFAVQHPEIVEPLLHHAAELDALLEHFVVATASLRIPS